MKKKLTPVWFSGFFLTVCIPLYWYALGARNPEGIAHMQAGMPTVYAPGIALTLYDNDSLGNIQIGGALIPDASWDTLLQASFDLDISPIPYSNCIKVVKDSLIYLERWDTLPQTRFWRRVITMSRDTCLINIPQTREILSSVPYREWVSMSEEQQQMWKDSLLAAKNMNEDTHLYSTAGKRHYYKFRDALPSVARGVEIFHHLGVDPWYAQAILLIESPGNLHYSPVGAYGSFQLMEQVAIEHGLIVNDSVDERGIFDKAAAAAADLIARTCVPQTRRILRKRHIPFRESDLWFRLMVLHTYHAGAGNVDAVLEKLQARNGGIPLIRDIWRTEVGGFKNASQNYSQLALASLLELDRIMIQLPDSICQETKVWVERQTSDSVQYADVPSAKDTAVMLAIPTMEPIPDDLLTE
ncbi:MAG: hypothetical protein AAF587_01170 [Bacteroidota bacterium]